jgi:hypothetical protein
MIMSAMRFSRLLKRSLCLALLLVPLVLLGCKSKTATVSGKVYYTDKNGKKAPLPGGEITFYPEASSVNPASATIGEDGTYTVDKVPVGKVKVTVSNAMLDPKKQKEGASNLPMQGGGKDFMPPSPEEMQKKSGGKAPAPTEKEKPKGKYVPIDEKYADRDKSGLEYTVESGSQDKDFELK